MWTFHSALSTSFSSGFGNGLRGGAGQGGLLDLGFSITVYGVGIYSLVAAWGAGQGCWMKSNYTAPHGQRQTRITGCGPQWVELYGRFSGGYLFRLVFGHWQQPNCTKVFGRRITFAALSSFLFGIAQVDQLIICTQFLSKPCTVQVALAFAWACCLCCCNQLAHQS